MSTRFADSVNKASGFVFASIILLYFLNPKGLSASAGQDHPSTHALIQRTPADKEVAFRLVAQIVENKLEQRELGEALQYLGRMESGEVQRQALVDVFRRASNELAVVNAGRWLLCEDAYNTEEVRQILVDRLNESSDSFQRSFLPPKFKGCSERKSSTLRFIPRTILRDFVQHGKDRLRGWFGAAGTSAFLLAESSDPQDKELIAQAVLMAPEIPGFWLSAMRSQAMGTAQKTLARAIVQNPAFPFAPESQVNESSRLLIRVAAATALSPDRVADAFAIREIRAYLSEFSTGEMNPARLPRLIEGPFGEKYDRYKTNLHLLGNLMYLQSPAAQEVTFEFLSSPDYAIRRTMAVVTAKRWPEQLLRLEAVDFAEDYGANSFDIFLAIAAFYHPDLEEKLLLKGNAATIQSILDGSRRGGIGWGWQGEGGVVIGGW